MPSASLDTGGVTFPTTPISWIRVLKIERSRLNWLYDYSWHLPDDVHRIGGPADKMLKWLDRCSDMTRRTIGSEAKYKEAYWQTLFAYLEDRNGSNLSPDPILGLQAHRIKLAEYRDSAPLTALPLEEWNAGVDTLAYLGKLWRGKIFFSTVHGRIGFADRDVMVGDSVCQCK
jgi:hypothetical protein